MITSTLWKTLFTYPTLREKQAGNPREETTPFPYSSLPLFYPSFTITATIHFLVEFSHREACYYIVYPLRPLLTITRKRIREEMIALPSPLCSFTRCRPKQRVHLIFYLAGNNTLAVRLLGGLATVWSARWLIYRSSNL